MFFSLFRHAFSEFPRLQKIDIFIHFVSLYEVSSLVWGLDSDVELYRFIVLHHCAICLAQCKLLDSR